MSWHYFSATPEWYTPAHVMDFVRDVLGGPIDFDPCSNAVANRTVQATNYLTKDDDGLTSEWHGGHVYVNPPGDKAGKLVKAFAIKALQDQCARRTRLAFMCFSLNQLATLSDIFNDEHDVFVFRKRIAFDLSDGTQSKSPAHHNAIIFVNPYDTSYRTGVDGRWYRAA